MTQTVAIVCGAGVSSTFLARAVRDLVSARGIDWRVLPLAQDQLIDLAPTLDLVLFGSHLDGRVAEITAELERCSVAVATLQAPDHLTASREALRHLIEIPSREGHPHG